MVLRLYNNFKVLDSVSRFHSDHCFFLNSLFLLYSSFCIVEFFTSIVDVYFGNFFAVELADSCLDIDLGCCHIYHSGIYSFEFSIGTLTRNDEVFDDGIEGIHRGEISRIVIGRIVIGFD